MYVESFFLTIEPPQAQGGSIVVGEMHDGVIPVPGFPAAVRLGAVIEIAADDADEPGDYAVELVIEYSRLGDEQAPIGAPFTINVLPLQPDWWGPRVTVQPLALDLNFWDEFEGYLVVKINDEEWAEKALRVVLYEIPEVPG